MNDKKLGENASTLYGAPEYPAWDAELTYKQYDRVSVGGAIYAAKKPSKGVEPFADDGSNWQFMEGTAHVAGDCFTVTKGNGGAAEVSASAINGGTAISVSKGAGVNTVSADIATAGSLGVVKIGTGLNIDENGTVTANIPVADEHKIGSTNGIAPFYVDQNESGTTVITGKSLVSSATAEVQQDSEFEYSVNVPVATDAKVGAVKPDNDSVTVDEDGTIHATPYALPVASADTLGGVKVGAGLSVDASGVLSASGGSKWVDIQCTIDNPAGENYVNAFAKSNGTIWVFGYKIMQSFNLPSKHDVSFTDIPPNIILDNQTDNINIPVIYSKINSVYYNNGTMTLEIPANYSQKAGYIVCCIIPYMEV